MKWFYVATVLLFVASGTALGHSAQSPLGDDPTKFDERVEAATTRHDVDFFAAVLADDVRFTHGTGLVQNRQQWLEAVRKSAGQIVVRDLDSVEVEPHGDVVETVGHIHVQVKGEKPREYHIWYVRLYSRRHQTWQLLSNRTVRQIEGPLPAK